MPEVDPELRKQVLERFTQGKKKVAEPKAASGSKSTVALDNSLLGNMVEHQNRVNQVNDEALKVKKQHIKETMTRSRKLMKSLFGNM